MSKKIEGDQSPLMMFGTLKTSFGRAKLQICGRSEGCFAQNACQRLVQAGELAKLHVDLRKKQGHANRNLRKNKKTSESSSEEDLRATEP